MGIYERNGDIMTLKNAEAGKEYIINNIVTNMPKQIFELSVDLINSDYSHLYFDQRAVEDNVDEYLYEEIRVYTKNYNTIYTFLNDDKLTVCTNGKSSVVKIDFTSTLTFNYEFNRSMIYEIWSRD